MHRVLFPNLHLEILQDTKLCNFQQGLQTFLFLPDDFDILDFTPGILIRTRCKEFEIENRQIQSGICFTANFTVTGTPRLTLIPWTTVLLHLAEMNT